LQPLWEVYFGPDILGSVRSFALSRVSQNSDFDKKDGRRPIYLCGLPLLCIGSLAVGLSRSIPQLMIWRFLQAFGASPGISVGAGVIGDIYKLEERGTAMGVFFAVSQVRWNTGTGKP